MNGEYARVEHKDKGMRIEKRDRIARSVEKNSAKSGVIKPRKKQVKRQFKEGWRWCTFSYFRCTQLYKRRRSKRWCDVRVARRLGVCMTDLVEPENKQELRFIIPHWLDDS